MAEPDCHILRVGSIGIGWRFDIDEEGYRFAGPLDSSQVEEIGRALGSGQLGGPLRGSTRSGNGGEFGVLDEHFGRWSALPPESSEG